MRERFDVIVVRGGTSGCVLAARLSEEPERMVCLVEAGPGHGRYADGRLAVGRPSLWRTPQNTHGRRASTSR